MTKNKISKFKFFIVCVFAVGLFFGSVASVSAQAGQADQARQAVGAAQDAIAGSTWLANARNTTSHYWGNFVVWFQNLALTRLFLESDYSPRNFNRVMGEFGTEMDAAVHSPGGRQSRRLLRQGSRQFRNL